MTDEIFVSEKTGKRYRGIVDGYHLELRKNYIKITEIIEPKLEVGDWILWAVSESPKPDDKILSRITYGGNFPVNLYHPDLLEVRKSNGEVWIKKDGQWTNKAALKEPRR